MAPAAPWRLSPEWAFPADTVQLSPPFPPDPCPRPICSVRLAQRPGSLQPTPPHSSILSLHDVLLWPLSPSTMPCS